MLHFSDGRSMRLGIAERHPLATRDGNTVRVECVIQKVQKRIHAVESFLETRFLLTF